MMVGILPGGVAVEGGEGEEEEAAVCAARGHEMGTLASFLSFHEMGTLA